MVECSESTGTICPGLAARVTKGPPMISDSLLARARVRPVSSAARVACSPAAPVTPLSTTSHGQACKLLRTSRPARPARRVARRVHHDPFDPKNGVVRPVAAPRRPGWPRRPPPPRTRPPAGPAGPRSRRLAASAATRKRPGLRLMMSSAWVPIEPVEPRITTSRTPERVTARSSATGRPGGTPRLTSASHARRGAGPSRTGPRSAGPA